MQFIPGEIIRLNKKLKKPSKHLKNYAKAKVIEVNNNVLYFELKNEDFSLRKNEKIQVLVLNSTKNILYGIIEIINVISNCKLIKAKLINPFKKLNQRKYYRLNINKKIEVSFISLEKESEIILEGKVEDISIGGLCLSISKDNKKIVQNLNENILVNFDKDFLFGINGEIVRIESLDKKIELGIKFINLDIKKENKLANFINNNQLKQSKKGRF